MAKKKRKPMPKYPKKSTTTKKPPKSRYAAPRGRHGDTSGNPKGPHFVGAPSQCKSPMGSKRA